MLGTERRKLSQNFGRVNIPQNISLAIKFDVWNLIGHQHRKTESSAAHQPVDV